MSTTPSATDSNNLVLPCVDDLITDCSIQQTLQHQGNIDLNYSTRSTNFGNSPSSSFTYDNSLTHTSSSLIENSSPENYNDSTTKSGSLLISHSPPLRRSNRSTKQPSHLQDCYLYGLKSSSISIPHCLSNVLTYDNLSNTQAFCSFPIPRN